MAKHKTHTVVRMVRAGGREPSPCAARAALRAVRHDCASGRLRSGRGSVAAFSGGVGTGQWCSGRAVRTGAHPHRRLLPGLPRVGRPRVTGAGLQGLGADPATHQQGHGPALPGRDGNAVQQPEGSTKTILKPAGLHLSRGSSPPMTRANLRGKVQRDKGPAPVTQVGSGTLGNPASAIANSLSS